MDLLVPAACTVDQSLRIVSSTPEFDRLWRLEVGLSPARGGFATDGLPEAGAARIRTAAGTAAAAGAATVHLPVGASSGLDMDLVLVPDAEPLRYTLILRREHHVSTPEQELEKLAGRLQAVLSSSVDLAGAIHDTGTIYRTTFENLAFAIRFDTGTIQLIRDTWLEVVAQHGFSETRGIMGLEFPLDPRFPNYHVVHGKRPLALADIRTDFPHFTTQDGEFQSGHIRSWLGVPLLDRGEVTGMLTLDRTTVAPFNADDIEIAQALANHVAAALSNARLYERLQRANNLQQMLLRELHHRVKNNLQLISSLLSLRSRDISEESADLVQELRTHIHAMAATHDNLFQPGLSEDVQLEPYLTEIIHGVRSAYVTAGSGIRVETDLDDKLRAGMRQAVPIGLIASEMVLNAIKHAFPDSGAPDRPNVIRTTLTRKPGIGIELTVGDTGTGIPNAAEPPSGFGLTLIETLAQQLEASLTVEYFDPEGERGTLWTLIIP